jgi:hypothetical protein
MPLVLFHNTKKIFLLHYETQYYVVYDLFSRTIRSKARLKTRIRQMPCPKSGLGTSRIPVNQVVTIPPARSKTPYSNKFQYVRLY